MKNGNGNGHQRDDADGETTQLDLALVEVSELRDRVTSLHDDVRGAVRAANRAANAALEAASAVKSLREEMADSLAGQTAEILRLIRNDGELQARMEAFDRHVEICTRAATDAIEIHAGRAGQGLARRVVVPVGAITALGTLIQLVWHLLR